MQRGPGYRHHQRRGGSLAAHVTDGEVHHVVVTHHKVVQVAAHLLGGHQLGVQHRRKVAAKHAHLYVAGHAQLALHAVVGRRGGLELLYVVGERLLHVGERVAQGEHLVVALHLGQRHIEVAAAHALRRHRQVGDGAHHAAHYQVAQHKEYQQAGQTYEEQQVEHAVGVLQHVGVEAHYHRRPAGTHGLVGHVHGAAPFAQALHAVVAAQHTVEPVARRRVGLHALLHVEGNKAVGGRQRAAVGTQDGDKRPLVGLHLLGDVVQPLHRHVGRHNGEHSPYAVLQRVAVGRHLQVAAALVVVGVAPVGLAGLVGHAEPLHVVVVVVLVAELLALDAAVGGLIAVGRKPWVVAVVPFGEGYGAAAHQGLLLHHLLRDAVEHLVVLLKRGGELAGTRCCRLHLHQRQLYLLHHGVKAALRGALGLGGHQLVVGSSHHCQRPDEQHRDEQQDVDAEPQRQRMNPSHNLSNKH